MIIGDGNIAQALKGIKDDKIYFVSGVSNSAETRKEEFIREEQLLLEQKRRRHIVYCSSLCVFYLDTPYARHKKKMETLVMKNFHRHTILRLGNITWGDNPHTIINDFRKKIKAGKSLELQNTYRYMLSKDEFLHWIKMIPNWPCQMNIPGKRMHVLEIAADLERYDKIML